MKRNDIYETKVSDARRIAYDIPGNIGWIACITGVTLLLVDQLTEN